MGRPWRTAPASPAKRLPLGCTGSACGVSRIGGVHGFSGSSSGPTAGVRGLAQSPNGAGVVGVNGVGGNAVRAEVPAGTGANAIAMYALNYSSYTGGGPGAGGFAVYGLPRRGTAWSARLLRPVPRPSSARPTASQGPMRPRSTAPSSSAETSPSSEVRRVRQCHIPTARIVGSTAWRVPRAGSRISEKPRWSVVRPRSRSIQISRRSWTPASTAFLTAHNRTRRPGSDRTFT